MSMRRGGWTCVLCFSAVSGVAPRTGSVDRRMTLDVTVTDKKGQPIAGLQQQDFVLLDNKQPDRILSFQAIPGVAGPAVEATLVMDEVNTSFSGVAVERDQIEKFLRMNGGELSHPVSIVFLTDSGLTPGVVASQDGKAIAAQLVGKQTALRSITRSQGVYGDSDRIDLSVRALQELAADDATRPGRKLVIWISPGWPFLSGPNIEITSKHKQQLFGTIVALSDSLRQARITLDAVDPLGTGDAGGFETTQYRVFLKEPKNSGQVQIGDLGLQVLAYQSGGRVLNSSNDVAGEIATCAADGSAFYVLSFDSLPGDGPNEYHALDVKVDKPGLTAHTRTGYYAQP
jgi:VWFA-related protein